MSAKNLPLLATAVVHTLLSLGHTTKGFEMFGNLSINSLPTAIRTAVKAGWYEGSVFFAMMAILNYKWSQTGLVDSADKAIASLLTTLLLGAGTSYYRGGDKPTGVILAVAGALQGWSARQAAL
ncbi:hypothetical protein K491DRAFT_657277 [Lophiostoma macrostomum CBS 122681]|uniref:Uncharacterized protein n=1 Tax=Lophiostoma macrostomum CBS 122681 TaxID=1314788 RepID=A0A6A6T899_9PLEO|nr:hypothetical protein K491DRAFT_657277 [Lophiostoma macrostomum CBS 122681]